ncbi:hypothetical protein PR048_014875 [Dryococelus australis]|uniref:Uncharacterized protein n=1 Tax=Dryococelus australis TaxID=614101 RepID=A0ABQ9HFD3_9NEOP|nr:hypothetical protein PR048_014875 [Dryococelus australis]
MQAGSPERSAGPDNSYQLKGSSNILQIRSDATDIMQVSSKTAGDHESYCAQHPFSRSGVFVDSCRIYAYVISKRLIQVEQILYIFGKQHSKGCSEMKIRNVKTLTQSRSPEELALGAQLINSSSGKINVAEIIKGAMTRSPRSVERAKRSFEVAKGTGFVAKGIQKEKCVYLHFIWTNLKSYPKELSLTYTKGEVQLQSLLNHTAECLLIVQETVLQTNFPNERKYILQMTHKWWCDGSSGHSGYKQKFSETHESSTDSDVLMISVVPLQLTFQIKDSQEKKVIWWNPRTSSTRYCLPVRFRFFKETPESIRDEFQLQIKKWQVRGSEVVEMTELKRRKKEITDRFQTELGLRVDVVRQGRGQQTTATFLVAFLKTQKNLLKLQDEGESTTVRRQKSARVRATKCRSRKNEEYVNRASKGQIILWTWTGRRWGRRDDLRGKQRVAVGTPRCRDFISWRAYLQYLISREDSSHLAAAARPAPISCSAHVFLGAAGLSPRYVELLKLPSSHPQLFCADLRKENTRQTRLAGRFQDATHKRNTISEHSDIRRYTQYDENIARQFRALHLMAIAHFMLISRANITNQDIKNSKWICRGQKYMSNNKKYSSCIKGHVAQWLEQSFLNTTNRGRFPAGSLHDFRTWEAYRTMALFADLLKDLLFPPPSHSSAAPYSPRFTLIVSEDPYVENRLNLCIPLFLLRNMAKPGTLGFTTQNIKFTFRANSKEAPEFQKELTAKRKTGIGCVGDTAVCFAWQGCLDCAFSGNQRFIGAFDASECRHLAYKTARSRSSVSVRRMANIDSRIASVAVLFRVSVFWFLQVFISTVPNVRLMACFSSEFKLADSARPAAYINNIAFGANEFTRRRASVTTAASDEFLKNTVGIVNKLCIYATSVQRLHTIDEVTNIPETVKGGHGGIVVRLLAYHQGESGPISDGVNPRFSHVGIVPDDVTGLQVFSGISRFPHPCIPALFHTHLNSGKKAKVEKTNGSTLLESRVRYTSTEFLRPRGIIQNKCAARCCLAEMRQLRLGEERSRDVLRHPAIVTHGGRHTSRCRGARGPPPLRHTRGNQTDAPFVIPRANQQATRNLINTTECVPACTVSILLLTSDGIIG